MRQEQLYNAHIQTLFRCHDLDPCDICYTDHVDTILMTLAAEEPQALFIGTRMLSTMAGAALAFVPIEAEDFWIDIALLYLQDNSNPAVAALVSCALNTPLGMD